MARKSRASRKSSTLIGAKPEPLKTKKIQKSFPTSEVFSVGKNGIGFQRGFSQFVHSQNAGILGADLNGAPSGSTVTEERESAGLAIQGSQGLNLRAGLEINAGGAADSMLQAPLFHSPGNSQDAYNLPKSYIEQIRWSRLMYNLNAFIGAITDLKAYYPFSKFDIMTSEPFVTEFYTRVAFNKNFNLYRFALRQSLSKHKFGEYCSWGSRSQDGIWSKTGKPKWVWDNFILLEPELMEVKKPLVGSGQPQVFLRPSRDLAEIVEKIKSGDPEYRDFQKSISPKVLKQIEKKELIEVDPSTVSLVQNLTDASAIRGTPPYQRLFVTFVLEDFSRLAQMAGAQRWHFPIELFSLGDLEKNILPNQQQLDELREMISQALLAPPFTLVFPPILKYEALGVQGKTYPFQDDYDYVWRNYTVGLGVSEELILGSSGLFSSTETSSNQAFIRARQAERDEWEEWARYHFFEPLARWNNLKVKKGDELVPIIPDIKWSKTLDFLAEERETKAAQTLWDKGVYPTKRLLIKNNENPDEIKKELEEELGGVFDDGKRILAPAIRKKMQSGEVVPGETKPELSNRPESEEEAVEKPGAGSVAPGAKPGKPEGGAGEEKAEAPAATERPAAGAGAAEETISNEAAPVGNAEEIL